MSDWEFVEQRPDVAVRCFARAVLHGDAEHRQWLTEAAEAYIACDPLPKPRGGSDKDKRIAELEQQLAEARAALEQIEQGILDGDEPGETLERIRAALAPPPDPAR